MPSVLDGLIKEADLKPDVQLQPHQKRVLKRLQSHPGNLLLMHALGSGKSLTGIASAEQTGLPYTAVVPASLRTNMRKELDKFVDPAGQAKADVMSYTGLAQGKPVKNDKVLFFDECLPAGTLVDGKPIETICPGEFVHSFNHATNLIESRQVIRTAHRSTDSIVLLKFSDGGKLACTPNHPVYTCRGYVPAEALQAGDIVYRIEVDYASANRNCVSPLQEAVCGLCFSFQSPSLLLAKLCEGALGGRYAEGTQNSRSCHSRSNDESQPDVECGHKEQGQQYTTVTRPWSMHSARQRIWTYQARSDGCCGTGLANRCSCWHRPGALETWNAKMLCLGRGKQSITRLHRDRRAIAQSLGEESDGCKKDRFLTVQWVESVEIYKQGSGPEFERLCPDGVVYDLTVDGNHNFFAEGYLVHNSHRLRNPGSLQTQRAMDLAARAKQVELLTGTPIVNDPSDLAVPMSILTKKQITPKDFTERYVGKQKVSPGFWGWLRGVPSANEPVLKHPDELKALLSGHVDYYAPERATVPTTREDVPVEMSTDQARLYRAMWGQLPWLLRWKLQHDYPLSNDDLRRATSFLVGPRQVGLSTYTFQGEHRDALKAFQTSTKLQEAYKRLTGKLKDPRTKALVFSNFIDAGLTPYAAGLAANNVPHAMFHGGLSDLERKKLVDDFNTGRIRVALLGPSGSEGLSFKGTQLVQLLDPYWNSVRGRQSEGRALRYDSHWDLPEDLKNVTVQRYISKLPLGLMARAKERFGFDQEANRRAADDYLENMAARKDKLNKQFIDVLKEVGSKRAAHSWLPEDYELQMAKEGPHHNFTLFHKNKAVGGLRATPGKDMHAVEEAYLDPEHRTPELGNALTKHIHADHKDENIMLPDGSVIPVSVLMDAYRRGGFEALPPIPEKRADDEMEQQAKNWVKHVMETSFATYPPPGVFTRSPAEIADAGDQPGVAPKGLTSWQRMVLFHRNRGGRGLADDRRQALQEAIQLLSQRRVERQQKPELFDQETLLPIKQGVDENWHTDIGPEGQPRILDVNKLWEMVNRRKARTVPINQINMQGVNRSKSTGFSQKRYETADTSYPVIIDYTGRLIDGRHRLYKLLDQAAEEVPVHKLRRGDAEKATVTKEGIAHEPPGSPGTRTAADYDSVLPLSPDDSGDHEDDWSTEQGGTGTLPLAPCSDTLEKASLTAKGIPDRSSYGDPQNELTPGDLVDYIVQRHEARRAGCFAAGAPVLMADGQSKAIEDVEPGDIVHSNGCLARVLRLWHNGIGQAWLRVRVGNQSCFVTPDHCFYVAQIGWVPICILEATEATVDEHGYIHVKNLHSLQQYLHNYKCKEADMQSKLCDDTWTSTQRSANDAMRSTAIASQAGCSILATDAGIAMAPTKQPRLVSREIQRGATYSRRDRGIGWLYSRRRDKCYATTWHTNPQGAYRAIACKDISGEQLELERRYLQRQNLRIWRWRPYKEQVAQADHKRTRSRMRVVQQVTQSARVASHNSLSVLKVTCPRECCTSLSAMPRGSRSAILGNGRTTLYVERLPRFPRVRYDLEIEAIHCYRVAGCLVHNSHYDIRLGTPETGLFSWASRKGVPEPGQKRLAIQQPLHSHSYGKFEGTICKGYGAGKVYKHDVGQALVTKVGPDGSIHFTLAHTRFPERFMLLPPKVSGQKNWLMLNTTKTQPIPYQKVRYATVPPEKAEEVLGKLSPGSSVQQKIDGAASLTQLFKDHIEVLSYRKRKDTGGPIVHTERVFQGRPEASIPKHLVGTVLRGELYGVKDKGRTIEPQEVGGILNSGVARALRTQRSEGIRMRNALFDVDRVGPGSGATAVRDLPYEQRMAKVKEIMGLLPRQDVFHTPEEAKTPEDAIKMWRRIALGQDPITEEGIVIHPPTGKPAKVKLRGEHDVYVREFFPGMGKYKDNAIGGFRYSHEPEGPIVGEVGTGLSDVLRRDMFQNPDIYKGRIARVLSPRKLPSGALFAPALLALHEDYPTATQPLPPPAPKLGGL